MKCQTKRIDSTKYIQHYSNDKIKQVLKKYFLYSFYIINLYYFLLDFFYNHNHLAMKKHLTCLFLQILIGIFMTIIIKKCHTEIMTFIGTLYYHKRKS